VRYILKIFKNIVLKNNSLLVTNDQPSSIAAQNVRRVQKHASFIFLDAVQNGI
jgi:hypothetical protein